MKFYFLTFELQKYEKYQITFEITKLKTEKKTECWSRFIVIRKLDMLTFELLCLQFLVLARFIVCKVISAQAANDYV